MVVTLYKLYEAAQPTKEVKRWNRQNKSEEMVTCPSVVATYNKCMNGVDLVDG